MWEAPQQGQVSISGRKPAINESKSNLEEDLIKQRVFSYHSSVDVTAISRGQLSLGHRSCLRHCLRHTHEMRERTNCRRGCSFSFFSFMEYYTGKGRNGQDKKKKTCRETQHVKIDMERDASIIICRMVAVGENYNSTRDTKMKSHTKS